MSDIINGLTPGVPLTEEQKENLRKENAEASSEANRLAIQHRERDAQEGKGEPAVSTIASILKGKLEREEFTPREPKPEQATENV